MARLVGVGFLDTYRTKKKEERKEAENTKISPSCEALVLMLGNNTSMRPRNPIYGPMTHS